MQKITGFIKEVRLEMVHVKWPTRQETIWLTGIVVIVSFAIAYLLGFFDFAFSSGLTKLLEK
jgi:preprotein translocase SecE subunit